MRKLMLLSVGVMCAVILSGCGRDARITAINETKEPAVLFNYGNSMRMPVSFPVMLNDQGKEFSDKGPVMFSSAINAKQLEALVIVGLLEKSQEKLKYKKLLSKEKEVLVHKYSLTELGQKYYAKHNFQFGTYAAKEIITATEPANLFGRVVMEVQFIQEVKDVAPWATSPSLAKIFPALEIISTPKKSKALLVKTDKGWVHEKSFSL
ncbi:MAG: hypothetical protein JXR78_10270 [Victivallales bacterium]|nr:hypothetical protein [Victivallales bacterium]